MYVGFDVLAWGAAALLSGLFGYLFLGSVRWWRAVDGVRQLAGEWLWGLIMLAVPLLVVAAWASVGLVLGALIAELGAVAGCAAAFALYGAARVVTELRREFGG